MKFGLWKGGRKSKDFDLINRNVEAQFQIGGVDLYFRKYLGPAGAKTESQINELTIDEMTYGENNNRDYDSEYIIIKGTYDKADTMFELMQIGLTVADGTLMIFIPHELSVERLGRKVMNGDVIEFPNLRDEDVLGDELKPAINRMYVVQDVIYPESAYSYTWFPHMLRLKAKPLTNSREFASILNKDIGCGETLKGMMSSYNRELAMNDKILDQAFDDVDRHYLDAQYLYIVPYEEDNIQSAWMFTGDGIPPRGALTVDKGDQFPEDAKIGDYFLRVDFTPERLFRREENKWKYVESNYRPEWSAAQGFIKGFIENDAITHLKDDTIISKQSITKPLGIKADDV